MTRGETAITKPNKEIAIPAALLRLVTNNNPNTIIKTPRATVPIAIVFINSQPPIVSELANDILDILRIRENVDLSGYRILTHWGSSPGGVEFNNIFP